MIPAIDSDYDQKDTTDTTLQAPMNIEPATPMIRQCRATTKVDHYGH